MTMRYWHCKCQGQVYALKADRRWRGKAAYGHVSRRYFTAMPHIVLGTVHVILQVSKCQLRLNHPELCQMTGCIAVLCPAHQNSSMSQATMPPLAKKAGKHHDTSRQLIISKPSRDFNGLTLCEHFNISIRCRHATLSRLAMAILNSTTRDAGC